MKKFRFTEGQMLAILKEEVGDAYRVIDDKPVEAPIIRIDERLETLADGHLVAERPKMARFHPDTSYLN